MQLNTTENVSDPVVRIKLPWTTILGATGVAAGLAISMWASVNQLTEQVKELKVAVQQSNQFIAAIQSDVNLLKYRQDTTERMLRDKVVEK